MNGSKPNIRNLRWGCLPMFSLRATIYYPNSHGLAKTITYFPRLNTPKKALPRLPWGRQWSMYRPAVPKPPRVRENQDPFAPGSTYRSYWRKYAQREAEAMRRGGVCLFEGWQEGILDERMVRAFFSGCVVATVIPEVEHRSISSFLLPLSPSETDGLLLPSTQLSDHLANLSAADLERKATGAFAEAWKLFTPKCGIL
ncbi:hypothetical protein M231_00156 [Tremella mesenterica]|uniref:Uncharacterized protein n=1 Tax=Tremella mesenterica TaxID=5217 RepID=A0A4Q1BWW0_TREME|nr:hypothetical protein M231_00156 [Tremella mesenterica]